MWIGFVEKGDGGECCDMWVGFVERLRERKLCSVDRVC